MTLEITVKVGCSNNCYYCPQGKLLRSYTGNIYMTTTQFKKILDNTPKEVQIDFAGYCEPFLNPWTPWMIRHATEQGYDVVLDTTLTDFSENEAILLKGVRLKQVYVHDYPGSDRDIFDAKTELLRKSVITDKFEIGKLRAEHIFSRAGNLWDVDTKTGPVECAWNKDLTRNVVLPNGDVYLCCMDYSLKHRIGNIYKTHYNDLNRNKIKEFCSKDGSDVLCRNCEIAKML